MNLHDLIIIRENFIPGHIVNSLLESTTTKMPATVGTQATQSTNLDYRKTNVHPLPKQIIENLNNSLSQIHDSLIKPKYNSTLEKIEPPQLLSYDPNGHYDEHNDCEDYIDNVLTRVIDRDITTIFYLNDNYTGGELEFTQLGLTYRPKRNSMIVFPSYYEFSHRVHPVKSGTRMSLVCWLATKERIYDRTRS